MANLCGPMDLEGTEMTQFAVASFFYFFVTLLNPDKKYNPFLF